MRGRAEAHLAFICTALLLACGGEEQGEAQPSEAPPGAVSADLSLADVAGTWSVQTMPEDSDSTLITFELTATADTTGWQMQFPGRTSPIPISVLSVAGDSVVIHAGPYDSALQQGTMVTIHGPMRLEAGQLTGRITATYTTQAGDSVVMLRTQGSRMN